MKKSKLFYVLPLLIAAIFISGDAFTKLINYTLTNRAWDVPGPGVTTRKDCTQCHTDVAPVTNDTTKRIFTFGTGLKAYVPDTDYKIKIKFKSNYSVGFSSTVLKNDSNKMVGTITPDDTSETKVFFHSASGRYYINHRVGTPSGGEKEYEYKWRSPAKGTGAVTFYFSSLTSNDDSTSLNDTTYLNAYVITENPGVGNSEISKPNSFSVFPNPVNDRITIAFINKAISKTQITLYSIDGKQALILMNENLNSGEQNMSFDLSGKVKPGIYFVRVDNGSINSVQKILIY